MARAALAWLLLFVAAPLAAAEYRATAEPATVLYDAPSAKAKPMFVYGRDVPVEVLVGVEGWTKIRDSSGTIGWMPSKSLAEKRVVVVRPPVADVRASPEENAPVVNRKSGFDAVLHAIMAKSRMTMQVFVRALVITS